MGGQIWIVYLLPCMYENEFLSYGIRIDLFHNNFSPNGEQPEHRKLIHEL